MPRQEDAAEPAEGIAPLSPPEAATIARMALGCVERPHPYAFVHLMRGPDDLAAPRTMTPAFYGCFDWHSAVHAHWTLARVARRWPGLPEAARARGVLDRHLRPETIAAERAYLDPRPGFERPYGLAWVLALAAELHAAAPADARAGAWRAALAPLEALAVERLLAWFDALPSPVRSGEHANSAFAMALAWDWARAQGDASTAARVAAAAERLHGADRDAPLHLEPSGQDFLSPSLSAADLMRRVRGPAAFAAWLDGWLPGLPRAAEVAADWDTSDYAADNAAADNAAAAWLPAPRSPDRADGKLAHLDGLASSRAWALAGIASGLPEDDARRPALRAAAALHAAAGRAALATAHYAGTHWLGTFALYAATEAQRDAGAAG